MRQYELVVILPLEEEKRKEASDKLLADLAGAGANIAGTTEMGERDLAYEIKGVRRAKYVLFDIKIDPAKIAHVENVFRLNASLIRWLFCKKVG